MSREWVASCTKRTWQPLPLCGTWEHSGLSHRRMADGFFFFRFFSFGCFCFRFDCDLLPERALRGEHLSRNWATYSSVASLRYCLVSPSLVLCFFWHDFITLFVYEFRVAATQLESEPGSAHRHPARTVALSLNFACCVQLEACEFNFSWFFSSSSSFFSNNKFIVAAVASRRRCRWRGRWRTNAVLTMR